MSLGYIGKCNKIFEDEKIAIYSYSGENWNDNGYSKSGDYLLQDGRIVIHKECLEEPEVHTKTKRMPSGKKKTVIKIIPHTPDILKHVNDRHIIVEKECKNAFKRAGTDIQIDYIAYRLLLHIFESYQRECSLPDSGRFIQ